MSNASTEPKYINLRVQSSYSLLESALTIDALAEVAKQAAQASSLPAIGIADRDNLFGALEFSEAMAKQGAQPIIGVTLYLSVKTDNHPEPRGGDIALYAKNDAGYRNLLALVSHAHLHHLDYLQKGKVGITSDTLAEHTEGLICLSGGVEGVLDKALALGQNDHSRDIFALLNNMFGNNLYVELQRYRDLSQPQVEAALLDLAYEFEVPLVATNQSLFAEEDDYHAHDALICIADGTYVLEADRRRFTLDHRLKSPQEMCTLFADLPEALENTIEIAKRCAFRPRTCAPILPNFGVEDEAAELARQAGEGLEARLAETTPAKEAQAYHERLAFELDVINNMGFAGYFLIVADFIQWSKRQGIAVGPGRGSGAGSVVAWALTITDLDPLRFNLLFERFLNPERISMPDFDIDFCQSRRDEVISYVQERYGADKVAQIITFGKLQARAVLRDVGRVLQVPYGQVDRLCKMIPNNPAAPVTLQQAIDSEPRLKEEQNSDERVADMMAVSLKLEGLYRHASTHAAGVVISDRPLQELIPLYNDPKSDMRVTQFNMKWVENAGLVKFDFLGLKTLTVIEQAINILPESERFDIAKIPLDDAATFELLRAGDTIGVFQLEGAGMRDALRNMKIDTFEDIIALVSLYRPGPMENIPRYISVKTGKEQADYLHPSLEPVLRETHGVIIYQEQVMQIAQILAGYSLGEADVLRRAMGKKIKSEMKEQETRFVDGAVSNGIDKSKAKEIFALVDKFAGYGFNKSHAAAYALIAYQTAYLKAKFPHAFYAASMTLDFERTEKLNIFRQDAAAQGITIAPPDVNRSGVHFAVDGEVISYALSAIRNVGTGAMEMLVGEREENGAFDSLADFVQRIGGIGLNRRLLENLIKAGALDSLEPERSKLMAGIEILLGEAGAAQFERETNQENMFAAADGSPSELHLPDAPAWSMMARLSYEFEAIGYFLSGHPLDDFATLMERNRVVPSDQLAAQTTENILMAGSLIKSRERKSKQGKAFAFATLSDRGGEYEVLVPPKTLEESRMLLEENKLILLGIKLEKDKFNKESDALRLIVTSVREIEALNANNETSLRIFVGSEDEKIFDRISAELSEAKITERGKRGGQVYLTIGSSFGGGDVEIELDGKYNVSPNVLGVLKTISGVHVQEL